MERRPWPRQQSIFSLSPPATRDVKDFAALGIELIDPWSPSA